MSSVVLPSLTDQIVLGVFKYLVEAELRKSVQSSGQVEFRYGCQEGMIASLVIMFGEVDDLAAETAYNSGSTWIHVVGEIVTNLKLWKDTLESENMESIDFDGLQDAVDEAVNEYALKHPTKLGEALRKNL